MRLRQALAFNTRATANVFSKEDTERYPGQPGFQRMDREGPPRKSVRPRNRRPEPEGDREIRELLHAKVSRGEQLATLQMMWGRDGQGKTDLPTGPTSFPMRLCSRLDGRYSEAFEPRSRGEPAPSPQQNGTKGKDTTHATLRVRDSKRRMWSMSANPDEARARRRSGDLARNRSTEDHKECTDLVSSPEGRKRQPQGVNATLQVRRAPRNF